MYLPFKPWQNYQRGALLTIYKKWSQNFDVSGNNKGNFTKKSKQQVVSGKEEDLI
jgi:hypothetical protein